MSAGDKFILAIDLGTSGPKAALFSTQGELVGSEFEEIRFISSSRWRSRTIPG